MSYSVGVLGAKRQRSVSIRPFVQQSYDSIVDSFSADIVSYWKFQESAGATVDDVYNIQDATITGVPERDVPTIVDLDSVSEGLPTDGVVIAWTGGIGEYAQAAHNAAHKTASGTIVVTAQHDTLSEKAVLVAADANGAAGGFSIEVNTDGSPRAYIRNSAGTPIVLTGVAGDIDLDVAYTHIFKWGTGGLFHSVWDANGNLVRRSTNATTDGLAGTSAIRFGAWHTDITHHDGPYGRVVWLDRHIAHAEEPTLARAKTIVHVGGGETGEYITTPEEHGWTVGGTATANTTAMNDAINDASVNAATSSTGRGVVELVQNRIYTVVTTNGAINDGNGALLMKNNVELRTTGKPVRGGNQAIIRWESWSGKTGYHNRSIVKFINVSNAFLGWVTIDGNKNTMGSITDPNYTQGGDGAVHNIVVRSATTWNMKEVTSTHSVTDCLLVSEKAGATPANGGLIEDCTFTRGRRQGFSGIKSGIAGNGYDQNIFRRCIFSDIGDFSGDVGGQRPAAGVDIEPDSSTEVHTGTTFDDCDFINNKGSAYHHGVNQGSVAGGRGYVADARGMTHAKFLSPTCTGNRGEGFVLTSRDDATINQVQVTDLVCTGNTTNNRLNIFTTAAGQGLFTNTTIVNANVTEIFISANLRDTGHSITIWRGSFSPTITTNGKTTVTINNGFP